MAKVISGPTVIGTSGTADSSLFFPENLIPESGSKVKRVSFGATVVTLAGLNRFQAFASGTAFIDCTVAALRAVLGFMCKRAELTSTDTDFALDFGLLMPGGAAPAGRQLKFVFPKSSSPAASTLNVHEYLDDAESGGYPSLITGSANIPASATTQPYNIQNAAGSTMAGLYIPDVANVTLLRYYDEFGLCYEFTSSGQITTQFKQYAGTTVFTDVFIPVRPSRVIPGVTRLEISTGGSWAGVANEIGSLTYVANPS